MGLLLVDKPEGPTSHDVVARARRSLGVRRVGHTGTLDPFASGLLLLMVGPATRLIEYTHEHAKEYRTTVRLGVVTDSADPTGSVERTVHPSDPAWTGVDEAGIRAALAGFLGTISQIPPLYSAKKIGGVAAHRRMRAGQAVELTPTRVTIHALDLTRVALPDVDLTVRCSTGTYVRALGRDLGAVLGVGGHLTHLRRTAIGPLLVEEALSWDELSDPVATRRGLRSAHDAVGHLPALEITEDERADVILGRAIGRGPPEGTCPGMALAHGAGKVWAVGEWDAAGFQPRKVFPDGV